MMARGQEDKLSVTISVTPAGTSIAVAGADGTFTEQAFFTMLDKLVKVAEMLQPDTKLEGE